MALCSMKNIIQSLDQRSLVLFRSRGSAYGQVGAVDVGEHGSASAMGRARGTVEQHAWVGWSSLVLGLAYPLRLSTLLRLRRGRRQSPARRQAFSFLRLQKNLCGLPILAQAVPECRPPPCPAAQTCQKRARSSSAPTPASGPT